MEWHLPMMQNIQGACLLAECTEMWYTFMGFGMKVDVLLSTIWLLSRAAFLLCQIICLVCWLVSRNNYNCIIAYQDTQTTCQTFTLPFTEVITYDNMGSPCLKKAKKFYPVWNAYWCYFWCAWNRVSSVCSLDMCWIITHTMFWGHVFPIFRLASSKTDLSTITRISVMPFMPEINNEARLMNPQVQPCFHTNM